MGEFPRFTLRISKTLLKKVQYMATYSGRSKNREIEYAIKRSVRDFENLHGCINTNELED